MPLSASASFSRNIRPKLRECRTTGATEGRISIGNNEMDVKAISFTKGQVRITPHGNKAEHGTLAGPNGLEKACVAQFEPTYGQPFRIQIAESGAQALYAWAQA